MGVQEATASLDRWQTILDAEGHAAVMRIVDRSTLRQLWPDEMFRMGHAAFMQRQAGVLAHERGASGGQPRTQK